MTTVQINQVGTDVTELDIFQNNSNEATVILNESLLDGTKQYHFSVSELNCNLVDTPIFGWISETTELFRLVRRNSEVEYDATESALLTEFLDLQAADLIDYDAYAATYGLTYVGLTNAQKEELIFYTITALTTVNSLLPTENVAEPSDIYRVQPGRKFYDPSDFVRSLSDWAMFFNKEALKAGRVPQYYGNDDTRPVIEENADGTFSTTDGDLYEYTPATDNLLTISVNCDGALQFAGLPAFWNNWVIKFTNTGAALMGVDTSRLLENYYMSFSHDIQTYLFYDEDDRQFEEGMNESILTANFKQSVFQSAECRVRVSVDSHLPINSNIVIRDETETTSRDICSAYFLNDIRTETTWDAQGVYSGLNIKSRVYSGQYAFIKKDQPIFQWVRLLQSENIQFFRFFLLITYRTFDEEKSQWGLLTKDFPVRKNTYWQMVVRFVSDE